jgi:hypothetical protein
VIFEEVDGEYFFELILDQEDFDQMNTFGGIIRDYVWENGAVKLINIYLHPEKKEGLCHLSKEKKPKREKGSQRTLGGKSKRGSHKSRV